MLEGLDVDIASSNQKISAEGLLSGSQEDQYRLKMFDLHIPVVLSSLLNNRIPICKFLLASHAPFV